MSDDTMLDRLARAALGQAGGGCLDDPADGEWARGVVRAILTALRSPTEGMLQEGIRMCGGRAAWAWESMIDHILNEEQ